MSWYLNGRMSLSSSCVSPPSTTAVLSRFCRKPDQEIAVAAYLERLLLSSCELDAEMQRRCNHSKTTTNESVSDTGLECPAPQQTSHGNRALGTFYDFCHYSKMCSECGKMADDDKKMGICHGCKTEHYCNRVCQKTHWSKQHKGECKMFLAAQEQQNLGHLCCQIASCMFVWGHMHHTADSIVRNICCKIDRAGLHDVLWLVSFKTDRRVVLFSTVSRGTLVQCIGKEMVQEAIAQSGPTRRVVLIVPTKHTTTGKIVYALAATFLQAM